ncbi:terminase family protein [Agrobacterium salinitolerans]|uniref:terminase large subunit domain-containing protein n=1 Tax=Agrobacterium salinitolerans TaxID=1183413 RepID=UPI0022B81CF4|nr:terminase family protein [Agrobacterium salinitolerans]MCZ7856014.1 terminase family protein [Agrobacterium salinitolerans]
MELEIEIVPREQFRGYLNRKERWASVVAHRRCGKTVACIMDLIKRAIEHQGREPRFAYVAPTYTQAKDVAWSYLKEYTSAIPGIQKSESELSVTLPHNGARIRLYGAENYDRIRGLYLDGCIIDETGDIDPRAWPEVIRPALSDRKGWATFIGTPKGRNAFYDIHQQALDAEGWYSATLKASQTGAIDQAELEDAKRSMTPEQYAQEYECSFDAAVKGSYYGKDIEQAENEKRIGAVPHDRAADTFASWDLGIGDMMSIWVFQIVGKEWHWIKYYENNGLGLDHYVDWTKALPFTVHRHYLPHDAEARELQTGKSRIEFLRNRGLNCEIVPRHEVDDGVNAARTRFNRFWFDRDGCKRGIDCLRMYRSEFDEKNQVLKSRPLHDWASHGADSFRYGVMGGEENKITGDWKFKARKVV